MACMGRHLTKPQGYRPAASERLLCLFVICIPYYQALLFAGMSGMISFLLLTILLMFVVVRSHATWPERRRPVAGATGETSAKVRIGIIHPLRAF